MRTKAIELLRGTRGVLCIFTVLTFVLGATRLASAQWSATNAQSAWAGFNDAFLHTNSDGSQYFVNLQGSSTPEILWKQAEDIETAEDAYKENETTANKNEVLNLINGFRGLYGDNWSSDLFNDDLNVATIAFARCYQLFNAAICLTDAETNFATVWNRAQAGDGGLCEASNGSGCYENSSANWTFVIAGNLLYQSTGIASYNTEKNSVYTWAKANLYDSTTGEIYDATTNHAQYTYNYGYAMIAGGYQGSNVMVPNIANYVFNDLTNYAGTYDGYNIMPDYGNTGSGGGFNGILMRGVQMGNHFGYIPSAIYLAAQANIDKAWSERNGTTTLIWDDWVAATPSTGTYSWEDNSALPGLLDLNPTS